MSLFVLTVLNNLENAANDDKRLKFRFLSQFARVPFSYLIRGNLFVFAVFCPSVITPVIIIVSPHLKSLRGEKDSRAKLCDKLMLEC